MYQTENKKHSNKKIKILRFSPKKALIFLNGKNLLVLILFCDLQKVDIRAMDKHVYVCKDILNRVTFSQRK